MNAKNPLMYGFAVGAISAKLNQLQVIHLGSPTEIGGRYQRTKIILDQMGPYVDFLAEECGWVNQCDTDDSSDGASA